MRRRIPLPWRGPLKRELVQSVELSNWDGETELAVGCDYGGSVTVTATETSSDTPSKTCAWWQQREAQRQRLAGRSGRWFNTGWSHARSRCVGTHQGKLAYRHDTTTDGMSLSGTYDGKPLTTPRPAQ